MNRPINIHATALVVGEYGILVRGASGIGKTRLALALVAAARRDGGFACLVSDDRTLVFRHGDRLVVRPHPALAGRVEQRGLGILPIDHEPACVLRLVVDLIPAWPARMPDPQELLCEMAGVVLPRVAAAAGASTAEAVMFISTAVEALTTSS